MAVFIKVNKKYLVALLCALSGISGILGNILKSTADYAPVVGWLSGFLFITSALILALVHNAKAKKTI